METICLFLHLPKFKYPPAEGWWEKGEGSEFPPNPLGAWWRERGDALDKESGEGTGRLGGGAR